MTKANLIRFGENQMKKNLAMLFAVLLWAEFAHAKDVLPRLRLVNDTVKSSEYTEEVRVVATNLTNFEIGNGLIPLANGKVLVHNYNPITDSWVFVGTQIKDHIVHIEEIQQ